MRFRDRLAQVEMQAVADLAAFTNDLLAQLSISAAKRSAAITKTSRDILAELEERGELTEPVASRIVAQSEADLTHYAAFTREVTEALVQLLARCQPQAGFTDRLRLIYQETVLPYLQDDSF